MSSQGFLDVYESGLHGLCRIVEIVQCFLVLLHVGPASFYALEDTHRKRGDERPEAVCLVILNFLVAVQDEFQSRCLAPTSRERKPVRVQLLPEHGAQGVTNQHVQHGARLLTLKLVHINKFRILNRLLYLFFRNGVKENALCCQGI